MDWELQAVPLVVFYELVWLGRGKSFPSALIPANAINTTAIPIDPVRNVLLAVLK